MRPPQALTGEARPGVGCRRLSVTLALPYGFGRGSPAAGGNVLHREDSFGPVMALPVSSRGVGGLFMLVAETVLEEKLSERHAWS